MNTKEIRILTLLAIDTAFFFLELIIGYAVHSLALVADSFHMLNDVFSLIVALWAVRVAKSRGVDSKYTYGWQRAEILGALINGVFLVALCMTIFLEAIQRFVEPQEISNPKLILIVGSAGLASNIVGLVLFHDVGHAGHNHDHGHGHGHSHSHSHSHDEETHSHDQEHEHSHDDHDHAHANTATVTIADPSPSPSESTTLLGDDVTRAGYATLRRSRSLSSLTHINHYHNKPKEKAQSSRPLNMQGVFLHVMGDALGNIGVMLTALFIWLTDYSWRFYMDPMISLVITCIIFSSALPLCRNASSILLQGVPESIDADEVKEDLASLPGVENIHDLHIWILREDLFVATLHVSVSLDEAGFMDLGSKIRKCLRGHGIQSVTIQPEFNCPPATPESLSAPHCVTQGHMSTGGLSS